MATQPAALDPGTVTFEATVTAVDGDAVALDETYFYAESGGQPADRGAIDGVPVDDVQLRDGTAWHTLETATDWSTGERIVGEVDPTFRRYCMCAHTASHAVYGAARVRFDDVGYGGFEITPTKVRLDLETPVPIDDAAMLELERRTNEVIWEDRPVTWSEWPAEEVRANETIALNVATEVIHTEDTVRVVEIADWDLAACGGTHVSSTGEIGEIAMADRSNPGEGQTRLEFVVGPARIDLRHAERTAAFAAKARLGVPVSELPERVERLEADKRDLEARVESMEAAVVSAAISGPDARRFERNGATWTVATLPTVEASTAVSVAEDLVGEAGDVIVVAGGDTPASLVVVSDGSTPATAVIDAALDGFDGGGGGGSDRRAQAGGIGADAAAVVEHLLEVYAGG